MKLLLLFFISGLASAEVLGVFRIVRHGARSPSKMTDDTDLFGNKWEGDAVLDDYGRAQHFITGIKLRDQYSNNRSSFFFSTLSERTIKSTESQLAGFDYKGKKDFSKYYSKLWEPNAFKEDFEEIVRLSKEPFTTDYNIAETKVPFDFYEYTKNCSYKAVKDSYNYEDSVFKEEADNFRDRFGAILTKHSQFSSKWLEKNKNILTFTDALLANVYKPNDLSAFFSKEDLKEIFAASAKLHEIKNIRIKTNDNNTRLDKAIGSTLLRNISMFLSSRAQKNNDCPIQGVEIKGECPFLFSYTSHDSELAILEKNIEKFVEFQYKDIPFATSIEFKVIAKNSKHSVEIRKNDVLALTFELNDFVTKVFNNTYSPAQSSAYCSGNLK